MNILGFSLGFNASAAIVSEGKVVAAISQERLNNLKNTKEFPIEAMIECCKISNIKEIDAIAFSHYQDITFEEMERTFSEKYKKYLCYENLENILEKILNDNGISLIDKQIYRCEHHEAHLNAAFPIYGEEEEYIGITSDGFGDGFSLRIVKKEKDKELKVLEEKKLIDSIALVYQFFTGALGFKMHQHEGKITGLASYGKKSFEELLRVLFCKNESKFWEVDENKLQKLTEEEICQVKKSTIVDFEKFLKLKKTIFSFVENIIENGASKEDLAKTVQDFSEHEILNILENLKNNFDKKYICYLSGGLFANVKINQRIKEVGLFSEIAVVPPMGDEGTAIGAAFVRYSKYNKVYKRIESNYEKVLSGTKMEDLNEDDVEYLTKKGFEVYFFSDEEMIEKVSEKLKEKKIVCLCIGKMEFGPRALCHRSILYDCSEKETNNWLNNQLGRTEFMPFAPVCLDKNANDLFENIDVKVDRNTKFMTMTFDCKKEFIENYAAACHIDNTARPQVLVKEDCDNFVYCLLESYEKKTGKKALINTSFNLHNFPIIQSKENAIFSWEKSNTDILVINNALIERK